MKHDNAISTEPISPNGLVRDRNNPPYTLRMLVYAIPFAGRQVCGVQKQKCHPSEDRSPDPLSLTDVLESGESQAVRSAGLGRERQPRQDPHAVGVRGKSPVLLFHLPAVKDKSGQKQHPITTIGDIVEKHPVLGGDCVRRAVFKQNDAQIVRNEKMNGYNR